MTIQIQFGIANRAHHIIPYKQGRLRKYIEKYGVLVQKSFDRDIETYIDCSMADYDAIPNNLCMNLTSFWADFTCG